jgi:fatty-acyl-CoA synthase
MRILLAGDSRCACPPRPNSWPHIFETLLRQHKDVELYKFFAVEDTYIFTIHLLEEQLTKYPEKFFDYIIIHSGWHDYIESWPKEVMESLIPNGLKSEYLLDESDKWIPQYKANSKNPEFRYLDKNELLRIDSVIASKCNHHLYIGMHSVRDGSDLHKKEYYEHHQDILESNDFFSKMGDFLNLPQSPSWTSSNTTHDKIHYTQIANINLARNLLNYVGRRQTTVQHFLELQRNGLIVIDDVEVNGEEFYTKCKMAGSYISLLTNAGDVVLIDGTTSIDQVCSFIGCLLYKRIPLIVQTPSEKVSSYDFDHKMKHVKNIANPSLCLSNNSYYGIFNCSSFGYSDIVDADHINPEDVAFYQLSSGTTGDPKLISVKHYELIEHCLEYSNICDVSSESVVVSWLPLYHDMGLVACFLLPLICGASIVHINPFKWIKTPQMLFDSISKYSGTHCFLPNFALNYLVKSCQPQTLPTLKMVISCSEPTSMSYLNDFEVKFNTKVSVCYALAENIFAVSHTNDPIEINNIISCGAIIPGVSVIIEKNNIDVTEIDTGNILIKSNYSQDGDYYGYYNTGDLGFIHNGELFVTGRSSDKIVSFGNNIYPDKIEEVVSNIDGVVSGRVACFGIFNEDIGTEEVYICVDGIETARKEIYNRVSSIFNVHPSVFIDHNLIVKTSSGKISRAKTKSRFVDNLKNGSGDS